MSICLFSLSTLQKQTKRIANESNVDFITDSISHTKKLIWGGEDGLDGRAWFAFEPGSPDPPEEK